MKAAIIHGARDLRIGEATTPDPGPGEVLVRVRAGGICGPDLHYYQDGGFGAVRVREPMILGHAVGVIAKQRLGLCPNPYQTAVVLWTPG